MYFSMTKDKKRQCYPLCIFSWCVIKSDSVTPYVLLDNDDIKKNTLLPLMFFSMTRDKKTTVLPLMFLCWWPIKNSSVKVYFPTTHIVLLCGTVDAALGFSIWVPQFKSHRGHFTFSIEWTYYFRYTFHVYCNVKYNFKRFVFQCPGGAVVRECYNTL